MKLPIDVLIEILDELRVIRKALTDRVERSDTRTAEQRLVENDWRMIRRGEINLCCFYCGYEVLRNIGACQKPECPFKSKTSSREEVERA